MSYRSVRSLHGLPNTCRTPLACHLRFWRERYPLSAKLVPPAPENEGGYVNNGDRLRNFSGYSVLEQESPAEGQCAFFRAIRNHGLLGPGRVECFGHLDNLSVVQHCQRVISLAQKPITALGHDDLFRLASRAVAVSTTTTAPRNTS